jgi:hypothetical protein
MVSGKIILIIDQLQEWLQNSIIVNICVRVCACVYIQICVNVHLPVELKNLEN